MSTVFEALVVPDVNQTELDVKKIYLPAGFSTKRLTDTVLIWDDDIRRSRRFNQGFEQLAAEVSQTVGNVLLIRYDDRVGLRLALLFTQGQLVNKFDEQDEIWVLLDEDGQPILNGKYYSTAERDEMVNSNPEEYEFETIKSAVQIGLERVSRKSEEVWNKMKELM